MIEAGKYAKPISIVGYAVTRHPITNEAIQTPSVLGAAWADVRPLSGRSVELAHQLLATAEIEFRIPYDPTLTLAVGSTAVRYRGIDWPIGSVINVDDGDFEYRILCSSADAETNATPADPPEDAPE